MKTWVRCFLKYGAFSAISLLSLTSFGQATQSLVLEKVYVKWLVDGSPRLKDAEVFCWNLKDLVLEGKNLPALRVNSEGPRIDLDFEIQKTNPNCKLTQDFGSGWKVASSSSKVMSLSLDATLPFSRFEMEDSRGRKLEILVEAQFLEIQESDFLGFFKDSIFSMRVSAIRNRVWQYPFLLTKYELPTLWGDRLALQIALGQSLFDASGKGFRQAIYELGLATPILGEKIPFRGPYNVRLRVAYEGLQINDQKSLGIYPLLAGQMLGVGSEFYANVRGPWGAQVTMAYYLSRTEAANLSKLQGDTAVRYALSERWSLEAGLKMIRQSINNKVSAEQSSFSEYTYFVGFNLKPYLDAN